MVKGRVIAAEMLALDRLPMKEGSKCIINFPFHSFTLTRWALGPNLSIRQIGILYLTYVVRTSPARPEAECPETLLGLALLQRHILGRSKAMPRNFYSVCFRTEFSIFYTGFIPASVVACWNAAFEVSLMTVE